MSPLEKMVEALELVPIDENFIIRMDEIGVNVRGYHWRNKTGDSVYRSQFLIKKYEKIFGDTPASKV